MKHWGDKNDERMNGWSKMMNGWSKWWTDEAKQNEHGAGLTCMSCSNTVKTVRASSKLFLKITFHEADKGANYSLFVSYTTGRLLPNSLPTWIMLHLSEVTVITTLRPWEEDSEVAIQFNFGHNWISNWTNCCLHGMCVKLCRFIYSLRDRMWIWAFCMVVCLELTSSFGFQPGFATVFKV